MTPPEEIEFHYNQAREIALKEVIWLAQDILKKHPALYEFCMAMGSWSISKKNKDYYNDLNSYSTEEYLKPLQTLFANWDEILKLTGEPMRFTAKSGIKTDW